MSAPTKTSRLTLALLVLVPCMVLDQWTKRLAEEHLKHLNRALPEYAPETEGKISYLGDSLRLTHAYNDGAFLGFGSDWDPHTRFLLLTLATGLFIAALGVYGIWQWSMESWKFFGVQLIFAGGLGNLVDRIAYEGRVIDFMNMGVGWLRTGIFNVADIAITAGALLLLFLSFRKEPQHETEPRSEPEPSS